MSLRDWLQSSNSSESSESLQSLSSSASCSAPTTSVASRSMNKRKLADANDLVVGDPKQVSLRLSCKHVWGQEKMLQCCVVSEVGLV